MRSEVFEDSNSSGLWHCIVLWMNINISEVHAASIFRVKWLAMGKTGIYIGLECKWAADAASQ